MTSFLRIVCFVCGCSSTHLFKKGPPEEKYHRSRGICFSQMGDANAAIMDFRRAVSLQKDKNDQQSRVLLCETLYNAGKFADAINETYFLGSEALIKLGDKLCSDQKFGEAIRSYTQAINVEPSEKNYELRGLCYTKMGTLDRALSDFEDAARKDERLSELEKMSRGRVLLARALIDSGREERAETEIQALDDVQLLMLGRELLQAEEHEKALRCFTIAIEKYPENASCYEARGHCYRKRNDLEEAMLDFEKTVLIDPSRVNCWIDFVEVLNEAKRYDEAEQVLGKLDPIVSNLTGETLARIEKVAMEMGSRKETKTPIDEQQT